MTGLVLHDLGGGSSVLGTKSFLPRVRSTHVLCWSWPPMSTARVRSTHVLCWTRSPLFPFSLWVLSAKHLPKLEALQNQEGKDPPPRAFTTLGLNPRNLSHCVLPRHPCHFPPLPRTIRHRHDCVTFTPAHVLSSQLNHKRLELRKFILITLTHHFLKDYIIGDYNIIFKTNKFYSFF